MHPGSIVRCRNREWVVMPADTDEFIVLRPLTGTPDDVVHIHRKLMNLVGGALPFERITPASFPLPTTDDISDATSAHLLWQAARLTLRYPGRGLWRCATCSFMSTLGLICMRSGRQWKMTFPTSNNRLPCY